MIVMKFGGTSVGSAVWIRRVAAIVAGRAAEGPIVVTSAMSGVTNTLGALLDLALGGEREAVEQTLRELAERHQETARALGGDAVLAETLSRHLRELRVLLRGVRLLGTATARSRDAVLRYGEMLAQPLVARALEALGCRGEVWASGGLLRTDDRFGAARPDLEATRASCLERLVPRVEAGIVPVLGGYLGATEHGIPTTLGRGGSDLSASIFGLASGASAIEIWTDVDGMLSADPRVVPAAHLLERVSFAEAAELAGYGAKVLHPVSIDPAIQGGLPVVIRNSLAPENPGTTIGLASSSGEAAAVAARAGLALVELRCPGRARAPSFMSEVLGELAALRVVPVAVTPGPLGIEFVLATEESLAAVQRALSAWGEVEIERGFGLVALVGDGLVESPDAWRRVLGVAEGARRVLQGPHGRSLALVVPEEEVARLSAALHAEWFERAGQDTKEQS